MDASAADEAADRRFDAALRRDAFSAWRHLLRLAIRQRRRGRSNGVPVVCVCKTAYELDAVRRDCRHPAGAGRFSFYAVPHCDAGNHRSVLFAADALRVLPLLDASDRGTAGACTIVSYDRNDLCNIAGCGRRRCLDIHRHNRAPIASRGVADGGVLDLELVRGFTAHGFAEAARTILVVDTGGGMRIGSGLQMERSLRTDRGVRVRVRYRAASSPEVAFAAGFDALRRPFVLDRIVLGLVYSVFLDAAPGNVRDAARFERHDGPAV